MVRIQYGNNTSAGDCGAIVLVPSRSQDDCLPSRRLSNGSELGAAIVVDYISERCEQTALADVITLIYYAVCSVELIATPYIYRISTTVATITEGQSSQLYESESRRSLP